MTTENPYAAPATASTLPEGVDRDRLRRIAAAQRQTNLAVLFYLCLIPVNVGLSTVALPSAAISLIYGVLVLGVLIFGAVSIYRLASQFYGSVVALIYVLGLPVPLLGLILLITLSSKATKLLKENGLRVGLFGADPAAI